MIGLPVREPVWNLIIDFSLTLSFVRTAKSSIIRYHIVLLAMYNLRVLITKCRNFLFDISLFHISGFPTLITIVLSPTSAQLNGHIWDFVTSIGYYYNGSWLLSGERMLMPSSFLCGNDAYLGSGSHVNQLNPNSSLINRDKVNRPQNLVHLITERLKHRSYKRFSEIDFVGYLGFWLGRRVVNAN